MAVPNVANRYMNRYMNGVQRTWSYKNKILGGSHERKTCVALAILLLLGVSSAVAQSTFGSITGTVTDQSGAVVPNASITVTNQDTGATRRVAVSTDGV